MQVDRVDVRLVGIRYAGPAVNLYELRAINGQALPRFDAGAHVDMHLSNGLVRQYSLAGDVSDRSRYVLGIKKDDRSRGGSSHVHEKLRVGMTFQIGLPRNNFALIEDEHKAVFIAGGIGVTPFLSMARRAQSVGMNWTLHAAVRTREGAEILADLKAHKERIYIHIDDECGGKPLSVASIVASTDLDTHLYCCGPTPMLKAFEEASAARPAALTHIERFAGDAQPALDGGYVVRLAKSNISVDVKPGHTIVDALREIGFEVETSCGQGVCGTCETQVLSGIPDHRDVILSDEERAANNSMMICCSGCKGDALVLDL